jgi:LAO/AO transport system kinase
VARRVQIDTGKFLAGDRVSVARAISLVENGEAGWRDLLESVYPRTGRAYRIGITGPPGAGKSTLTNRLALLYRKQGLRVGVIAVDPTSPFTGGALLGDRVRMSDVEMDEGVFIRSMASRGSLGGLSEKTTEAADLLDASGHEIIIMETVGVGQSELDIAGAADSTVVVLVPESGDSIQAMKAGLMEIADFFVLNKADRAGADQAAMSIQMILHFRSASGWMPSVLKTTASDGTGVDAVLEEIAKHRTHLDATGRLIAVRRERLERRIRDLVAGRLQVDFWNAERRGLLKGRMDEVMRLERSPYAIADELIAHFRER